MLLRCWRQRTIVDVCPPFRGKRERDGKKERKEGGGDGGPLLVAGEAGTVIRLLELYRDGTDAFIHV